MPRIHHQMGGKPINFYRIPGPGFPAHAACLGGYAPTVRKIEDETHKNCAASDHDDGTFSLFGRGRHCDPSRNRRVVMRQRIRRQRAVHQRQQCALRPASRTALQLPLTSSAVLGAASHAFQGPVTAVAAAGFLHLYDQNFRRGFSC